MSSSTSTLQAQACRQFVCPNMSIINELCDSILLDFAQHPHKTELRYDPEQMKRVAWVIAAEYFKRTYEYPRYASPFPVMAASVYLAGKLTRNWVTQTAIANNSEYQETTIRKWSRIIMEELGDEELAEISAS